MEFYMKKSKKLLISTIVFAILAIIYTIIIALVDKQSIGPNESQVGLATINQFFQKKIGFNETFYKLSNMLGYIAFGIAFAYMIVGLIQLIKRKSIKKVDTEISILGLFYIITLIIYVLFEFAKINYRPVLIDGKLDPSYPSSHTLLALFISTSAIFVNLKIIGNKTLRIILNTITIILAIVILIGRTMSGVHWITDILGGILIATTLVLGYLCVTEYFKEKSTNNKTEIA